MARTPITSFSLSPALVEAIGAVRKGTRTRFVIEAREIEEIAKAVLVATRPLTADEYAEGARA